MLVSNLKGIHIPTLSRGTWLTSERELGICLAIRDTLQLVGPRAEVHIKVFHSVRQCVRVSGELPRGSDRTIGGLNAFLELRGRRAADLIPWVNTVELEAGQEDIPLEQVWSVYDLSRGASEVNSSGSYIVDAFGLGGLASNLS